MFARPRLGLRRRERGRAWVAWFLFAGIAIVAALLVRFALAPEIEPEIEPARGGVVVVGSIWTESGPAAGAHVRVLDLEAWKRTLPYDADPEPLAAGSTDPSGEFRFDGVPIATPCVLMASFDGHAEAWDELDAQPDADCVVRRDVRVLRGARVSGVVVRSGGDGVPQPVAGASVWVADESALPPEGPFPRENLGGDADDLRILRLLADAATDSAGRPRRARTAADGTFTLHVPAATPSVRIIAFHRDSGRSHATSADASAPVPTRIELLGRVTAEFQVTGASGGPAAEVRLEPVLPWETWSARPLGDGRYGPVTCDVGPALCSVAAEADASGLYAGPTPSAGEPGWRIRLNPGRTVRGRVVGPGKSPIPDATVTAGPASATTDGQGEFELGGVPVTYVEVTASAPGYTPSRERAWFPKEKIVDVQIRLRPTVRLRFSLGLPEGRSPPPWIRVWNGAASYRPDAGRVLDRTDWEDGAFDIPDRDRDDDRFVVIAPGFRFDILEGTSPEVGDRDAGVRPLEAASAFRGIVTDEAGRPVPRAVIHLRATGRAPWRRLIPERAFEADHDGRFRGEFGGLPSAIDWIATVTAPGFVPTPWEFSPRKEELRLTAGRGFTISGSLVRVTAPTDGLRCRVSGPDWVVYSETPIGRDRTFSVRVPRRPEWIEIVNARGWTQARVNVPSDAADGYAVEPE